MSERVPWKRVAAEFVAIAAGVSLGLLADDYRDYRSSLRTEAEYLNLLDRDLELDLEAFEYTLSVRDQERAANALRVYRRSDDVPQDSVEAALSVMLVSWSYEQPRPTYLSLREAGQLAILRDPVLRTALIDYYDIAQERLQVYVTEYRFWQQRVRLAAGRHIDHFPVEEFQRLSPDGIEGDFVALRTPWSVFVQEAELWNDMSEVGVRAAEIAATIEALRDLNADLRSRLAAALR